MRILALDCENTNHPNDRLPLDDESQPHLVQVCLILREYRPAKPPLEITRLASLVRCQVESTPGAFGAHGIAMADTEHGMSPFLVAEVLTQMLPSVDRITAHNLKYDLKILSILLARWRFVIDVLNKKPRLCTMDACEPFCKIPATEKQIRAGFKKPGEFKQPKLEEALRILCGHELIGAHDALADTDGVLMLYEWLRERGHVQEAA